MPQNNKPIMLDDTCYFIGFESFIFAKIAHYLLNYNYAQDFLKAIIFPDSKRNITKDILMRIDFSKLYSLFNFDMIKDKLVDLKLEDWQNFGNLVNKENNLQMTLFS